MRVTNKFANITADLSSVGLCRHKDCGGYFCTPKNAVSFAHLGVDGIHFCVIPEDNDLTLEHSPVYVVSPMMPDHYVEVVAENFYDFISLVIEVKDAGALEYISYSTKEKFIEYIQEVNNTYNKSKVNEVIASLSEMFHGKLKKINDVYDYVKQIQVKTDLTKIQYTEEYYELIGN
jgi:hypothetical protein